MHQYPRPSPKSASAANSLQTNPTRTNNQRNAGGEPSSAPEAVMSRISDDGASDAPEGSDQPPRVEQKDYQRINQVIQSFFVKAALTIVSSRALLPQSFNNDGKPKRNKWFNLVLDETDVLNDSLADWKNLDVTGDNPPPLCIEIYLELQELTNNQALVVLDEDGKRWDAGEAISRSTEPAVNPSRSNKATQLLLERWRIEVGEKKQISMPSLKESLPTVYKKGVVLFRNMYTYLRLMPAWKYYRRVAKQPPNHPALRLRYRIINDSFKYPGRDTLELPLYPTEDPVTDTKMFSADNSVVGSLAISVTHRLNCDFRIDDSESLLSSHFMGIDDRLFQPSYRGSIGTAANEGIPGSLPIKSSRMHGQPDVSQAYGSLSTYHQAGPQTGSSPISALRAVSREAPSNSPPDSPPLRNPPNHRAVTSSKSSLRSVEGVPIIPAYQRRTSVSFQPFKAGSLSSSPALGIPVPPSPGASSGRASAQAALNQPRNRTSLNALPQAALRQPGGASETAIASSASSSPKPAPIGRYSSSFGHRRGKFSSGGSKVEDDNNSSGKASVASSTQPESGLLNEGEPASSGSIQTDEDNISDFLKLLEQKKDLKSLNRRDSAARESSMRRTTLALSKYQRMRDSNAALSESMSSSLMLQRSSSTSSRHLSNVPHMVAGTSASSTSSPGKPISPHTPHTPAIPSRLSANSIADYQPPHRSRNRGRASSQMQELGAADAAEVRDAVRREAGSTAIDIPTSPRRWPYARRASSVSQQNRTLDDDTEIYGMRSASVPTEERPELSLSELVRLQNDQTPEAPVPEGADPQAALDRSHTPPTQVPPSNNDSQSRGSSDATVTYRSRLSRESSLRSRTPFYSAHASAGSLATAASSTSNQAGDSGSSSGGVGSRTGVLSSAGSRYGLAMRPLPPSSSATTADDDEPLLFAMSELGAQGQGRRSMDEGRGGSSVAERRRGGGPAPWR